MINVDIYFQLFSVIIFILMLLVLVYYLTKINILNKEIKNSENIIQRIITELKQRLYDQDQKILDLDVKLNIVELRISKFSNQINNKSISEERKIFSNKSLMNVTSQNNTVLTETEKKILETLSYKNCTANELQTSLKKTREHTSRLLKKLFQEGYIIRDDYKKPYIYKLSNTNNITFE